jgi:1-acyl-sn-glycerol-3-phosphate acyltransferase
MNILADKQNTLLKIEASSEGYEQCYKEFISVYYKLRDKEDRCLYNRLSVRQRQILHPLLLEIYRIKNRLGGFSYEIIGDKRSKTDKPVIFAVTHVGKFDIEVVSEAIKTHYYLLSGDFEHLQGTVDAPFLALNGVIYFNERVAKDRQSAKERMIRLLQEGGNLMYFPEGTWNLSPNLPVLPCYWGIKSWLYVL